MFHLHLDIQINIHRFRKNIVYNKFASFNNQSKKIDCCSAKTKLTDIKKRYHLFRMFEYIRRWNLKYSVLFLVTERSLQLSDMLVYIILVPLQFNRAPHTRGLSLKRNVKIVEKNKNIHNVPAALNTEISKNQFDSCCLLHVGCLLLLHRCPLVDMKTAGLITLCCFLIDPMQPLWAGLRSGSSPDLNKPNEQRHWADWPTDQTVQTQLASDGLIIYEGGGVEDLAMVETLELFKTYFKPM